MGWASGFESGTRSARNVLDTYNQSKQRAELEQIANSTPETYQGFTAEQGDAIRKAAESGADVQYDDASKSYVITPKSMGENEAGPPAPVQSIAQQGITDFMGQRNAGSMSDTQVSNARQRAMAGVLMKSDPVSGQRMMRDVTQSERDDTRFTQDQERYGWEKNRAQREERTAAQAEKDTQDQRALDADVGDWFKGRLVGQDGQSRAATVDDHLAASQYRAGKLIEAGKVDAANKAMQEFNAQSLVKIQLQSAERDQAIGKTSAALAAGDLNAAKDFYNTYIPDGAHVTAVTSGPKGEIIIQRESMDGKPLPATTMKDVGQLSSALASFKDPMAIYNWTQNEFRNNLALRADSRAGSAETRAAANDKRARDKETAAVAAGVNLYQETNPNATPAQLAAVKAGVLPAVPRTDSNAPAEVKLANAYVQAGLVKDLASGLKMATQSKADSPEKVRAEVYGKALAANMGDPVRAQEATDQAMKYLFPQPSAGPVATFGSSAEVEAAAKAGKIKKGDKVSVGGRVGTWQ